MPILLPALALVATLLTPPASAKAVLDQASAQAKRDKKNVMVVFHASWCGWCKKLDAFLEQPGMKPIFDRSFVITHLVVQEPADKKALENPGGAEVLARLGGAQAGLPFFAVLSPEGKTLWTSIEPKKGNVGFPVAPNEVAHFMTLLRGHAPKMTEAERAKVETALLTKK